MHCPILVSDAVAFEVGVHCTVYKLSVDEFARGALHLADLLLPRKSVTPTAGTPDNSIDGEGEEQSTKREGEPDLLRDFCLAVLPTLGMGPEFHRVSAMCEDMVLRLRAHRLSVEAFAKRSVRDIATRPVAVNAMTVEDESAYFLDADLLAQLRTAGERQASFHRVPFGLGVLDLNSGPVDMKEERSIAINESDLLRWLHELQYYGFADVDIRAGDVKLTSTQEILTSGFSRFMGVLLDGVCLVLRINSPLPRENFRQDLLISHYRACRVRDAWAAAFLKTEGALHRLAAYGDWLTEKLQVLASQAPASESIYGAEVTVPLIAATRKAEGITERTGRHANVAAFDLQGE